MASTTRKLNNGKLIPAIGLGTWNSQVGEVFRAVGDAISLGYRHIDCALIYGNENEVGDGIAAKISDGTINRDDLFITSKVWCTHHSKAGVKEALQRTLKSLKLSYLDLYLIHWPFGFQEGGGSFPVDEEGKTVFSDVDFLETWFAMESCVKEGLVQSIGLSNFNKAQIERILSSCTIKPAVLQVECHPYLNQEKLLNFCRSKSIEVTAYSPLGSPARPWSKPEDKVLLKDPRLQPIADKHKKTVAQILLRYQFQRGVIVIPKSISKERIAANIDIFDFDLDQTDMETINSMNTNTRFVAVEKYSASRYYPFHDEY